jgi:hypothetical protein
MPTHHFTGAGKVPGVAAPGNSGVRRAALYLSSVDDGRKHSPALIDCARQAREQGLRVVTVVAEGRASALRLRGAGLGGKRLQALVERLGDGQFDVIVAPTGDAMITIGAAMPVHQGEAD